MIIDVGLHKVSDFINIHLFDHTPAVSIRAHCFGRLPGGPFFCLGPFFAPNFFSPYFPPLLPLTHSSLPPSLLPSPTLRLHSQYIECSFRNRFQSLQTPHYQHLHTYEQWSSRWVRSAIFFKWLSTGNNVQRSTIEVGGPEEREKTPRLREV